MPHNYLQLPYQIIERADFSKTIRELESKALLAARTAYAPYSRFHVGVALLLDDGSIVTGSNQENAAYPSGLCAERTALFAAGSNYPERKVEALLLLAEAEGKRVDGISPCGACRQVMAESSTRAGKPYQVILCGSERAIVIENNLDLLPFTFDGSDLPR